MQPIRIKACSESDLRMLGNLARNIQRVLPVTQADIDAATALGKGWVVWKVIEVNDPIDNLRGGTQLVIKQNSITPGQNVRRVLIVQGPGAESGYCTHYSWTNTSASYMPDGSFNFKGASSMPRRLVVRDIVNGGGTGSTASNAFKAYLAAQYAAGAPVIIVYPLATPTTESVAGQTLQVTDGDNTLEITQASLSGLELEAEYTKVE